MPTNTKYIQDPLNPNASIPNPNYVAPAVLKPITAKELTTQNKPAPLPTGVNDTNDYSAIMANVQSFATGLSSLQDNFNKYQEEQKNAKPVETSEPEWLKKYMDLPAPTNPVDTYNKAYEASGVGSLEKQKAVDKNAVSQAQSQLMGIGAQIQAITDRSKITAEELSKGGLGMAARKAISMSEARKAAFEVLPLQSAGLLKQAEIASLQGNLTESTDLLNQAKETLNTKLKLESDYQTALYNYERDKINAVKEWATEEQKAKLEAREKEEERAYNEKVAQLKFENEVKLKEIDKQLDMQLSPLDKAIKQAQLAKIEKETSLLGEPTPTEIKATKEALKNAQTSIPVMQDKISAIDELLKSGGMKARVGTSIESRKGVGFWGTLGKILTPGGALTIPGDIYSGLSGEGQQFAGGVHKVVTGLSLQALIDAKSKGATFGALSDAEMRILANSATQLNDWEIKDSKGNPTGVWDIDEASFKKELKNIQDLTRKALLQSQETILSPDEQYILDEVFTNQDPSSYFK